MRACSARELPPRLLALAARHGLAVTRVTVRSQRSRWGSCSRDGNIALNWRLLQMPHDGLRLRAAARVDAPASAEPLAEVLGRGRGRVSRLRECAGVAACRRPGALLMASRPSDDPPFIDSTAALASLYQAPLAEFIARRVDAGVAVETQRPQGRRGAHRRGHQALTRGLPRQPGVLAGAADLRRRARCGHRGPRRTAGATARRCRHRRRRDVARARRCRGPGGGAGRTRRRRRGTAPAAMRSSRRCVPRSRPWLRTAARRDFRTGNSPPRSNFPAWPRLPA